MVLVEMEGVEALLEDQAVAEVLEEVTTMRVALAEMVVRVETVVLELPVVLELVTKCTL